MLRQVRADFDGDTIRVYQAYPAAIADAALAAGRFVAPFSFTRMTWIKPSLRWLVHRSNWARKPGQERVLAVRVTRAGWEQALSRAVLTAPEPAIHGSAAAWSAVFEQADVHVQWDPERTLRGAALNQYSIQVGTPTRSGCWHRNAPTHSPLPSPGGSKPTPDPARKTG